MIIGGGALLVALIIYALLDCGRTDRSQVRGVPKPAWILLIIIFPVIGALLWLFLGKQRRPSTSFGPVTPQPRQAPDDDAEYLKFLDARAKREAESRRREEEREAELNAQLDEELRKMRQQRHNKNEEGENPPSL